MDSERADTEAGVARLGLLDAVCLIVGIIIGAGIFRTPAEVFARAPGPWAGLMVWVVGGLFALVGAFCFAELASTYPRSGGEYVYLTRAFGPFAGYLFAWAQLALIRPASIAAVAYIFAEYAGRLFAIDRSGILLLAGLSIVALTAINVLGVHLGTFIQNLLTFVKVAGLLALVVVGLGWGQPQALQAEANASPANWFVDALIPILWTYAGWHEAAYVASEVKGRRRNLPRALLLGTGAVIVIYLAVNLAYLAGLGFTGAQSHTLAADLLGQVWPGQGLRLMALLVSIAALGAVNGMIFTTARIYAEFGADHRLFAPLGHWSRHWGTPARALLVQGAIALALEAGVWFWGEGEDTFDKLVYLTGSVFWLFFLLTGVALFVLRRREPERERPFRVPFYPYLPVLFCAGCAYLTIGAFWDYKTESLVGLALLAAGLPFYFFPDSAEAPKPREELAPVEK